MKARQSRALRTMAEDLVVVMNGLAITGSSVDGRDRMMLD
jgi:hypothetical protein